MFIPKLCCIIIAILCYIAFLIYPGVRVFQAQGMRSLGIPNSQAFTNITKIDDAKARMMVFRHMGSCHIYLFFIYFVCRSLE